MEIDIKIDEKACVGCSLCVEVCPTKVFGFDEEQTVPHVSKAQECFGCLSCSEICPATAIQHAGVHASESYYHDPYAMNIVNRMGEPARKYAIPTDNPEALAAALSDLEVRLISVAAVLKQTLGQSLPAIGTQAGRSLATQLPRYRVPQSLDEALELAKEIFAPAWDLGFELREKALTVTVRGCVVREVCATRSIEPGGDLCTLFYGYLAGYLSKRATMRPRLMGATRGPGECVYNVQIYSADS